MTNRANIAAGLMFVTATLVVIPAAVGIVRDSVQERQTIAVLRAPKTFKVDDSHILHSVSDPVTGGTSIAEPQRAVELVAVVARATDVVKILEVWRSAIADPIIRSAGMGLHVTAVGEVDALASVPTGTAVGRALNAEEFSVKTGIRVLPFSVVIANRKTVLAAGPGLPDLSFIRDAADRFISEGAEAPIVFRRVTPQINTELISIEVPLVPAATP